MVSCCRNLGCLDHRHMSLHLGETDDVYVGSPEELMREGALKEPLNKVQESMLT